MDQLIRELHKISGRELPIRLEPILDAEQIVVEPFSFTGRIQEIIYNRVIGIRHDLYDRVHLRRELTAHALGHYFLHAGTQFQVHGSLARMRTRGQEAQADKFACLLLCPLWALYDQGPEATIWEVAESLVVPVPLVTRRLAYVDSSEVPSW